MGKASIKTNKSKYQLAREECGYTREQASMAMDEILSAEKIEKIENNRLKMIQPEDVWQLAKCYKKPELCNYYCIHECKIGKEIMSPVQTKELSQIAIETLNSLNKLDKEKERLLEIFEDGQITQDEIEDFVSIKHNLDKISASIQSLQLWLDTTIANGKLDGTIFEKKL